MGCVKSRDEPYAIKRRINKIIDKQKISDNCIKIKFFIMPVDKPTPEISQQGITKDTHDLKINEATLKNNVTLLYLIILPYFKHRK